jgi:hypothetical protein
MDSTILIALFTLTADIAVLLLFFWMKTNNNRILEIEHQLGSIRMNYMDRFDDIKDVMSQHHLEVIQKIVKLETYLQTKREK